MQPLCRVALGTCTWVSYPHDGPLGPLEPSGSCLEHPVIWGLVFNSDPAGLLMVTCRRQTGGDGQPRLPGKFGAAVESGERECGPRSYTSGLKPQLCHTLELGPAASSYPSFLHLYERMKVVPT